MTASPWRARVRVTLEGAIAGGLALLMLFYGIIKLIDSQFHIQPHFLDMRIAELRGFDLVWLMHGFSHRYEVAIGIAECGTALLVLYSRTRDLGVLIAVGIMSNIVMLNCEYKIGAIITSAPMLVAALTLAMMRWGRYRAMFWRGQTPPRLMTAAWPRSLGQAGSAALALVPVAALALDFVMLSQVHSMYAPTVLEGRYRVTMLERNGKRIDRIPGLRPGSYLYFQVAGWGRSRDGDVWADGQYRIDKAGSTLEMELFKYVDPAYASAEEMARESSLENRDLLLKGAFTLDSDRNVTITTSEPPGVVVQLVKDSLDWPETAKRRG